MLYNKHTWQTGEVITSTNLNNIEGGIKDLSDKTFDATMSYTTDFNGIITTEIENDNNIYFFDEVLPFDYTNECPTLKITFDEIEYICNSEDYCYGATEHYDEATDSWLYDWSNYPFSLSSNSIVTENPGTHTLKVEEIDTVINPNPVFTKAVEDIVGTNPKNYVVKTKYENNGMVLDECEFNDIVNAYFNGCVLYAKTDSSDTLMSLLAIHNGTAGPDSFTFETVSVGVNSSNGYINSDYMTIPKFGSISFESTSLGPISVMQQ